MRLSFLKPTYFLPSFFLIFPSYAFAVGGDTPIARGFFYVIDAINGSTGIAGATLVVMGHGAFCAMGIFEWRTILRTVIGLTIVFGASAFVHALKGVAS